MSLKEKKHLEDYGYFVFLLGCAIMAIGGITHDLLSAQFEMATLLVTGYGAGIIAFGLCGMAVRVMNYRKIPK